MRLNYRFFFSWVLDHFRADFVGGRQAADKAGATVFLFVAPSPAFRLRPASAPGDSLGTLCPLRVKPPITPLEPKNLSRASHPARPCLSFELNLPLPGL